MITIEFQTLSKYVNDFFYFATQYAQAIIRLPTKMEKDVVGTAMTKIMLESSLTAPPVTMTILLHVQMEHAHQVSILLATYK